MPLTGKDKHVEGNFERQYGKDGKSVFYATMNRDISRGKTPNLPEARRLAKKRKHKRSRRGK